MNFILCCLYSDELIIAVQSFLKPISCDSRLTFNYNLANIRKNKSIFGSKAKILF